MRLINYQINLILTWPANCVVSEENKVTTFAITDTKLYDPIVTFQLGLYKATAAIEIRI